MFRSADYREHRTECDNAELALRCPLVRVSNVNFAAQALSWLIRKARSRATLTQERQKLLLSCRNSGQYAKALSLLSREPFHGEVV